MGLDEFYIEKKYANGTIDSYEERVLTKGICNSFIPTSFIVKEGEQIAIYDHSGYIQVSRCRFRSESRLIELIAETIRTINDSYEYLFSVEHYAINADTVYYDPDTKKVKLAYVPEPGSGLRNREKLVQFIDELIDLNNGIDLRRVVELRNYIAVRERSLMEIYRHIRKR